MTGTLPRRTFLRRTLGTAGAVWSAPYFVPSTVLGYGGAVPPSDTITVGCIGTGSHGTGWNLRAYLELPDARVRAVCDVDSNHMAQAKQQVDARYGTADCATTRDFRDILARDDIDAVMISTPDHWHVLMSVLAMQAGKAIYVEKPVSFNAREGEMLVEAADKYRAVFQMGSQRRSSTVYQQVIKEVHGGLIGAPRFARCWYATQRGPIGKGNKVAAPEWLDWDLWQGPAPRRAYQDNVVHYTWHWFHHWGTGECGNNATHYVDVARWALNVTFPTRVTSGGGRLFHEGDDWEWFDTQASTFEFPGNVFMTWEGLSSVKARPYEGASTGCMIYGLKGAVLFTPNNVCTLFDPSGKELKKWTAKDVVGDATNRTDPTQGLDATHLSNFVNCIREKNPATAAPAEVFSSSVQ